MKLFRGCTSGIRIAIKQHRRLVKQHSIVSIKWQICRFLLLIFFPPFRADSRAPLKLISIFPLRINYLPMELWWKKFHSSNNESNLRFSRWSSRCALEPSRNFHSFDLKFVIRWNICIIDELVRGIAAARARRKHEVATFWHFAWSNFWYQTSRDWRTFERVGSKKVSRIFASGAANRSMLLWVRVKFIN